MSAILRLYKNILSKHPFLTQTIQSGLLMGTGDVIAQRFVEKKDFNNINFVRTGQFFIVGTFVVGPILTNWYKVLHNLIGASGKTVAIKKVLLDQFVFVPMFLVVILTAIDTVQGKKFETTKSNLINNYPDVLKANYMLWPWVQLGNFYIMPLQYQVLTVQIVALFWNTYLSWKTNKDNKLVIGEIN